MKVEIDLNIPFDPKEVSLLNMHSVLNVLNVVQFELLNVADALGDPPPILDLINKVASVGLELGHPDRAIAHVRSIDGLLNAVRTTYDDLALAHQGKSSHAILTSRSNLEGIFAVIVVRAQEIIQRTENPNVWFTFKAAQLQHNFEQVLHAIERNSHGAYHIVHNIAEHQEGDYLVYLNFKGNAKGEIVMPPVFQDVMRDLVANARKYTPPGGRIEAGLVQSKKELHFVVKDSGIGIPEAELEKVVYFGNRGSNVLDRPTRGGGFGLSKAYYVTKMYGGRMWIESPIDQDGGSCIEIRIPLA